MGSITSDKKIFKHHDLFMNPLWLQIVSWEELDGAVNL